MVDGQNGLHGQNVTEFVVEVIRNKDVIVLTLCQRIMANLAMERIITEGFVIYRNVQVKQLALFW